MVDAPQMTTRRTLFESHEAYCPVCKDTRVFQAVGESGNFFACLSGHRIEITPDKPENEAADET